MKYGGLFLKYTTATKKPPRNDVVKTLELKATVRHWCAQSKQWQFSLAMKSVWRMNIKCDIKAVSHETKHAE